jgi:putative tricarboxylic transport membrane protein
MRRKLGVVIASALGLVLTVAAAGDAQPTAAWAPKGNVTFFTGGGPGSGHDTTIRSAHQVLTMQKLITHPATVVNKPGGSGTIALAELVNQHKGKDDIIYVQSLPIITQKAMGNTPYGYRDITPIARVAATYYMFVVLPNSDIKDFKDLIARLRKDPKSVSLGGSTPPSDDWAAMMAVLGTAGVDVQNLKYIGYDGGQVATALLGGHVQAAANTIGEFAQHVEAGKARGLAITGPERDAKFKDVPTVKELGIDMVFMNWRGFFGPPAMPKPALTYWQGKFGEMVKTDAWKEIRARYSWADAFMVDGFPKYLEENTRLIEDIFKRTALKKK